VRADLTLDVEVVEQHKFTGQFMMVGRDLRRENAEAGIAVSLRQIAQHLIIRAVFLDHVNAIFDRAGITRSARNRIAGRTPGGHARVRLQWTALVALSRVGLELLEKFLPLTNRDDRQRPAKKTANVFLDRCGRITFAWLRTMP